MGVVGKIGDIIGGLFLLLTGIILLFLYLIMHKMANHWFMAFWLFFFLCGLGLGGIILGTRRIILAIRNIRKKEDTAQKQ